MEAFLDRRWQGWRNRNEDARAKTERKSPRSGGMTANEAYDVLGLKPASDAPPRRLMMKFHPDGGSTYSRPASTRPETSGEIAVLLNRGSLTVESGTFATPPRGPMSLWSPVLPAIDVGVCRLGGEDCHDQLGLGEDRGPRRRNLSRHARHLLQGEIPETRSALAKCAGIRARRS